MLERLMALTLKARDRAGRARRDRHRAEHHRCRRGKLVSRHKAGTDPVDRDAAALRSALGARPHRHISLIPQFDARATPMRSSGRRRRPAAQDDELHVEPRCGSTSWPSAVPRRRKGAGYRARRRAEFSAYKEGGTPSANRRIFKLSCGRSPAGAWLTKFPESQAVGGARRSTPSSTTATASSEAAQCGRPVADSSSLYSAELLVLPCRSPARRGTRSAQRVGAPSCASCRPTTPPARNGLLRRRAPDRPSANGARPQTCRRSEPGGAHAAVQARSRLALLQLPPPDAVPRWIPRRFLNGASAGEYLPRQFDGVAVTVSACRGPRAIFLGVHCS